MHRHSLDSRVMGRPSECKGDSKQLDLSVTRTASDHRQRSLPPANEPVPQEHGMCRRLDGDWMPWLPNTGLQSKHTTVVGSEGRLSTLSSTVTTGASGRAWRWRGRMPGPRARASRKQCTASGVESGEVGMQTTTHCQLCESQPSHAPGLGVVSDDLPLLGKTSVKRAATRLRGAT